jgi:hypothetical protein
MAAAREARPTNIKAPTALIAAEHDEIIPLASTQKLLARFVPGVATMVTLTGTGHNDMSGRGTYRAALQAALASP